MANELRKLQYKNVKANSHLRSYANASFVNVNANGDVVVDFCEEYVEPNMIIQQDVREGQFYPTFENEDSSILHITREMKHTVVMSRDQAKQLAQSLIHFASDGDRQ
jgi:hypothetical protein